MFSSIRLAAAGILIALAGVNAQNSSSGACNNSPSLCDKKYNEVTYLGAHDAAFLRDSSTDDSVSGNQYLNATYALDAGLRLIQAQVHDLDGTLELCHSSCSLLDAGALVDWLRLIKDWMNNNPNDVVTVLLVNDDELASSRFASAFSDSGLQEIAYTPANNDAQGSWPTLQSMIDSNQRAVTFVTNIEYDSTYPSLLLEFDYMFETPYEITTIDGFNCTVDRPGKFDSGTEAFASSYMGFVNHFKYADASSLVMTPDVDSIDTVNSPSTSSQGNLGLHLQQCTNEWGNQPTYMLIDFWSVDQPLEAVDSANSVSDATGRTSAAEVKEEQDGESGAAGHRAGQGAALLAFVAAALMLA